MKKGAWIVVSIAFALLLVVGGTYAFYVWNSTSDQETKIVTSLGAATVYFNGGKSITQKNLRPTATKEEGIIKEIQVKTTSTNVNHLSFNLYLDITELGENLHEESFRFALYQGTTLKYEGNFSDAFTNANAKTCTKNNTKHFALLENEKIADTLTIYTLYIWVDGLVENPLTMMQDQSFLFRLHAEGQDAILAENDDKTFYSAGYEDDNYLFTGDTYYLNPFNLDEDCNASNSVENPKNNPNQCMKWYEISEDDENVTLILNSNLGGAVTDSADITTTANTQMKLYTDLWDDRLMLSDGLIIDNYDYTSHKARMITMDELSYILENPNWSNSNYDSTALSIIQQFFPYLLENIDMTSWREAGYFTSTVSDSAKNYVLNKGGLDISVSDSYTHGVRPVIEIKKSYLPLNRNWTVNNSNVTYLAKGMVSVSSNASEKSLEYHLKNMRASGIKKAYMNVGHLELVSTNDVITLDDTITSYLVEKEDNIARIIKIGQKYGVEVIPWLNYPMKLSLIETNYSGNETWGDHVISQFKVIINNILENGFTCSDDNEKYFPTEIHLDAEPMGTRYQTYYTKLIEQLDLAIENRAKFSASTPAGNYFSTSYIQSLAEHLDGFNIMIYDSNAPETDINITHSKQEYLDFVKFTIEHYSTALKNLDAEFYAVGAMYEDSSYTTSGEGWPDASTNQKYTHLNYYNGEEIETLTNLVDAAREVNDTKMSGLGFYNWYGFSSYESAFNKGSYITNEYNYITIRKYFLRNWVYS